jgi:predicted nucleotidyltransferase
MMNREIEQYLIKVCEVLNSHNVEYLVVGGAAVNHYGFNRPSGIGQSNSELKADLDFWYNPTIGNYHNLINALRDLDVDVSELEKLVFDKNRTFLKIPHKDFHTDFLPKMEGLESFRTCRSRAEALDIGGVYLFVLSLEDLIANKRAVNRESDKLDIEEISKRKIRKRRGI